MVRKKTGWDALRGTQGILKGGPKFERDESERNFDAPASPAPHEPARKQERKAAPTAISDK